MLYVFILHSYLLNNLIIHRVVVMKFIFSTQLYYVLEIIHRCASRHNILHKNKCILTELLDYVVGTDISVNNKMTFY